MQTTFGLKFGIIRLWALVALVPSAVVCTFGQGTSLEGSPYSNNGGWIPGGSVDATNLLTAYIATNGSLTGTLERRDLPFIGTEAGISNALAALLSAGGQSTLKVLEFGPGDHFGFAYPQTNSAPFYPDMPGWRQFGSNWMWRAEEPGTATINWTNQGTLIALENPAFCSFIGLKFQGMTQVCSNRSWVISTGGTNLSTLWSVYVKDCDFYNAPIHGIGEDQSFHDVGNGIVEGCRFYNCGGKLGATYAIINGIPTGDGTCVVVPGPNWLIRDFIGRSNWCDVELYTSGPRGATNCVVDGLDSEGNYACSVLAHPGPHEGFTVRNVTIRNIALPASTNDFGESVTNTTIGGILIESGNNWRLENCIVENVRGWVHQEYNGCGILVQDYGDNGNGMIVNCRSDRNQLYGLGLIDNDTLSTLLSNVTVINFQANSNISDGVQVYGGFGYRFINPDIRNNGMNGSRVNFNIRGGGNIGNSGREIIGGFIGRSEGVALPAIDVLIEPTATNTLLSGVSFTTRSGSGVNLVMLPKPLTGPSVSDGAFRFMLNGLAGSEFVIQISSNLVDWLSISTNTVPSGGSVLIADPDMANQLHRFYRALPVGDIDPFAPRPGSG